MNPETFLEGRVSLYVADVRAALAAMEPESVDCVVTSPPYWGLRNYDVAGQIGIEPTLGEHLAVMVEVFGLVRRVLKPSGTLWINYGDCYATTPNGRSAADCKAAGGDDRTFRDKPFSTVGAIYCGDYEKTARVGASQNKGSLAAAHGGRVMAGGYFKPKDVCMVPNRLAIALQEDGWWVRSEIVWGKTNPMPESVRDRPSSAHEKIFLLARSGRPTCWRHRSGLWTFCEPEPDYVWIDAEGVEHPEVLAGARRLNLWAAYDYYYEAAAVRRGRTSDEDANGFRGGSYVGGEPGRRAATGRRRAADLADPRHAGGINHTGIEGTPRGEGRNLRNYEPAPLDVWPMATQPFREAHFATFPPELAKRCILAGCPPGGLVLDPFGGAGTTAMVALRHGRRAALIELNPDYARMARERIERDWMGARERAEAAARKTGTVDLGPLFGQEAAE